MAIIVVGLNHTTAPVEMRERLAFPDKALAEPLSRFRDTNIAELVLLSTCNRTEFYMQAEDMQQACTHCETFLASYHDIARSAFTTYLYHLTDLEAVRHLFRVAASLDSMVLGEPQILGQVKNAYMAAQQAGTTGRIFNHLFDKALSIAKAVRSETGISDHAVSVSYAAVELAKKIFENLQQRTVMILGAGETSELAARHFLNHGVEHIFVANRTPARAEHLAQELGAKAIPWEAFPEHLIHTDIVVSSTSAPQPIVQIPMVQEIMRARRGRPMFFIDIAVPRDIEPAINTLENVFLYDIDDLQHVVEANRRERQQEALAAEDLIWQEVRRFQQWLAAQDVVPTVVALRQWAEHVRQSELEKALLKLGPLDERQQRLVEGLTTAMMNKFLHPPTVYLKRTANEEQGPAIVRLIRQLFALDT